MTNLTIQASNDQTVDQIAKVAPPLPPDVWGVIANLSSSTLQEDMQLMGVCKAARQGIKRKWIEWLNKVPNVQQLFERWEIPCNDLVFRIASRSILLLELTGNTIGRNLGPLYQKANGDQKAFIESLGTFFRGPLLEVYKKSSVQDLVNKAADLTWNQWFSNSIIFLDKDVEKIFDLSIMSVPAKIFAGCFCLLQGRAPLFEKILETISSEVFPPAMIQFLIASSRINQMDVFKKLLVKFKSDPRTNKPEIVARLLVELASNNPSSEAISHLLASDDSIDQLGIFEAMRTAANNNQMEALRAILNGRPGQQIAYGTFRDLINEFADNPEHEPIIQLLTEELESRYPEGDPVEAIADAVAAWANDAIFENAADLGGAANLDGILADIADVRDAVAAFHHNENPIRATVDRMRGELQLVRQEQSVQTFLKRLLLPSLVIGVLAAVIFQYYANSWR